MADELPPISLDVDPDGGPLVLVGDETLTEPDAVARKVPALTEPARATTLAFVVNHLSHGYDYEPITDPASFRATYLAEYEGEDEEATVPPGKRSLRGFGLPRFDEIETPQIRPDGELVFYAQSIGLGIPFRVSWRTGTVASYVAARMAG
jgi:hypothetical protein